VESRGLGQKKKENKGDEGSHSTGAITCKLSITNMEKNSVGIAVAQKGKRYSSGMKNWG